MRLLVQGHDIKSIARALAITPTAANERLRTARQKLGVSSSREAARILAAAEGAPSYYVDKQTGVPISPDRSHNNRPSPGWIGVLVAIVTGTGVALMSLFNARRGENGAPRVVSTNPASAAVISPGPLKLSVTFDRPMHPQSYSFVQIDPATFPKCVATAPIQSKDGRTFTLQCTVEPRSSYEIWFNREPYMNFRSPDGASAIPFQLKFRTSER